MSKYVLDKKHFSTTLESIVGLTIASTHLNTWSTITNIYLFLFEWGKALINSIYPKHQKVQVQE